MTDYRIRAGVDADGVVFAEVSPSTIVRNAAWDQCLVGEEVEPLVRAASAILQAEDCKPGDYFCHWLELSSGVDGELKNEVP